MDPLIVQLYRTNAVENMSKRIRRFYNSAVIFAQGIVKKRSQSKSEINKCKMEIETSELRTGSSDEYVKEQNNKIAWFEKKMDHVRIVKKVDRKNIIESKTHAKLWRLETILTGVKIRNMFVIPRRIFSMHEQRTSI